MGDPSETSLSPSSSPPGTRDVAFGPFDGASPTRVLPHARDGEPHLGLAHGEGEAHVPMPTTPTCAVGARMRTMVFVPPQSPKGLADDLSQENVDSRCSAGSENLEDLSTPEESRITNEAACVYLTARAT